MSRVSSPEHSCLTPLRRPAVRPEPSRPWYVRVLDATGSEHFVYDAPGGKRVGLLLGEPIHRRPVLPDPTPPRRPAVRRPAPRPVVCPGFGFDKL